MSKTESSTSAKRLLALLSHDLNHSLLTDAEVDTALMTFITDIQSLDTWSYAQKLVTAIIRRRLELA